jgi:hypothetical protein
VANLLADLADLAGGGLCDDCVSIGVAFFEAVSHYRNAVHRKGRARQCLAMNATKLTASAICERNGVGATLRFSRSGQSRAPFAEPT